MSLDVKLIGLQDGLIVENERAIYDHNEAKLRVYKRTLKFFKRFTRSIYTGTIGVGSLFKQKKDLVVFVDVNARQIITFADMDLGLFSPDTGEPVTGLTPVLDSNLKVKLEYLTEQKIYDAMRTSRIPLSTTLVYLGAGAGIFAIIRMVLGGIGVRI